MHLQGLPYFLLAACLAAATSSEEPIVHEAVGSEELKKLLAVNHAVLASCRFPIPESMLLRGMVLANSVPCHKLVQTSEACQTCNTLLPELHRVAEVLPSIKAVSEKPIAIATVDCADVGSKAICEDYEINSYPAVRLIYGAQSESKGKEWSRYRGPQKGYSLTSFISRNLLESINRPQSQDSLDDLLAADSSVVILQTTDPKDSALVSSIAAQSSGQVTFGAVDKPELIVSQKASPSLLCYRNGEDYAFSASSERPVEPIALAGEDIRSPANVALFIEHCAASEVHEFKRRKMNHLYTLRKPIVYIFHDVPVSIRDFLNPLQKAWSGIVPFVHVDANKHADLATNLGLDLSSGFPAVTVEGVINDQVYPMPQDWEVEPGNMDAFVGGILHGKAAGGRDGMSWVKQAGLKAKLKSTGHKDEL